MATGNVYRKFDEIRHVVFEICERTDRQTDKQTDMLITILYTLTGCEVKKAQSRHRFYVCSLEILRRPQRANVKGEVVSLLSGDIS